MHGEISVRSVVGRGSEFEVRLPFGAAQVPLSAPAAPELLRGRRVLVVDDHPTSRRVFQAYLEAWQMRADATGDGEDALERLRRAAARGEPFDLVLLDHHLPGQAGTELVRCIRLRRSSATRSVILLAPSRQSGAD